MVTVQKPSNAIVSAWNKLYFVFDSTNNEQINYKYLVDLYIDGDFVKSYKIAPRPDNGYGVVEISKILQSYVTYDIDMSSGFTENANSMVDFYLKVGEEYGTTVTEYADLITTDTFFAINSELTRDELLNWDCDTYSANGTSKLFLTNAPRPLSIALEQKAWLYSIYKNTGILLTDKATITTYDSSNSQIATADISYALSSGDTYTHARLATGTNDLVDYGFDLSGVSYYTVQLKRGVVSRSELVRYNIEDLSCKYDNKRLHFLNKLGGYDSFNFKLVSKSNYTIEKKTFKKNPFQFNTRTSGDYNYYNSSTGDFYDFTEKSRGTQVYHVNTKEVENITSDWLSEEESEWLLELINSRDVYLEVDNELVSINITQTSYEKKKSQNESMFNLELSFEYANDRHI